MITFKASLDMLPPLPGGYEFAINGEKVTARYATAIIPKVTKLLAKYRISAPAEIALAEYMCPRLPPSQANAFCSGDITPDTSVKPREALANCSRFVNNPMVSLDRIQRRLGICSGCPKHERNWCMVCTGAFERLKQMMGGRRPLLPADRFSGVCGCARAYEAAVCSVDHEGEPWLAGVPETCWIRRQADV